MAPAGEVIEMELKYYPDSDRLNIELAARKSVESEEVCEGFVFDFDADGKVVAIEVDHASQRVNLEQMRKYGSAVAPEVRFGGEVRTAEELAEKIGVTRRALNLTIQNMRGSGRTLGLRPGVPLYTEQDELAIREWRQKHPRGRPRKTATA